MNIRKQIINRLAQVGNFTIYETKDSVIVKVDKADKCILKFLFRDREYNEYDDMIEIK